MHSCLRETPQDHRTRKAFCSDVHLSKKLGMYTAAKLNKRKGEKKKAPDSSCQSKDQNFATQGDHKSTNKAQDAFDVRTNNQLENKLCYARAHTKDTVTPMRFSRPWVLQIFHPRGACTEHFFLAALHQMPFQVYSHNFSKLTFLCLIADCQTFQVSQPIHLEIRK